MQKFKLFLIFFILAFQLLGFDCVGQKHSNKTVSESKHCGKCGKSVSVKSRAGMICPHCGVKWGRENTTHTQSYNIDSYNNYDWDNNLGYSSTECMCGRYKSANEFMCHKCKTTCVCGNYKEVNEVFCMKCRTTCVCGRKKSAFEVFCINCKTTCSCGGKKSAVEVFCSKCKTTCSCGGYKNPNDVFCKKCKYNYKTYY